MTATLEALSGLGPTEPAAFLVRAGDRRILLDCGAGSGGAPPPLERAGRVDAVVLSHAHPDHAGAVAALDRIGNLPVHATAPVLASLPAGGARHALPAHGRCAVAGIAVETGRTGHAIGGIWVRLAAGEGLLYMGDHTAESDVFAADPPPPSGTVVIDFSYGAAEEGRAAQAEVLLALTRAGPLLLPVPADGRGVEIALFLAGRGVAVALCPAVRSALAALADAAADYARDPGVVAAAGVVAASAPEATEAFPGTAIVAGATGDSGAAAALLPGWRRRGGTVAFTGYAGPLTAAARLIAAGEAVQHRWNVHPTLSDNAALARAIGARQVVPAFGDTREWPALAALVAPARLTGGAGPVEL